MCYMCIYTDLGFWGGLWLEMFLDDQLKLDSLSMIERIFWFPRYTKK